MLGRVKTSFNRKILDKKLKYTKQACYEGATSLLDVIKIGVTNQDYLVFTSKFGRREVAYVHDIRFDYVNGRIFVPCFVYKYFQLPEVEHKHFKGTKAYEKTDSYEIMYNQELEFFEIWNSKEGYKVEYLEVLRHNFFGTKLTRVHISDLPIRSDVIKEPASTLVMKYLRSFYFNSEEHTNSFYYPSSKSYLTNTERRLLDRYELLWYGEDNEDLLHYRDVRTYKTLDVCKYFDEDELINNDSYFFRVIDFESYLLCHLNSHVYWSDFTPSNLIQGKWFFEKYKYRGIAIIFKDYWLKPYKTNS